MKLATVQQLAVTPPTHSPNMANIVRQRDGRWMLRLDSGYDQIMYYSRDFMRLREHAERYFKKPLKWEKAVDGSMWAKL